jgi:photosystem II stability/assembly factor-like uncharacterized protein
MRRPLLFLTCLLLVGCGQGGPEDPWEVIELGTDAEFRDIYFLDTQNGWMVGAVGVNVPGGIIARTTDGGLTWTYRTGVIKKRRRTMSIDMNAVHFTDLEHGVIAADAGTIIRTEDGGETWKKVPPTGPVYARNQDVYFVDAMNGWIIGREGVRRTEDGGATWRRVDEEHKVEGNAIQFLDLERGWVAGKFGAVYHTEDGGVTWETVPAAGNLEGLSGDDKPHFLSLHFVDEDHGWIAGYRTEFPGLEQYHYAVMVRTSDGGRTWEKQMEGVPVRLRAVRFADSKTGWAVGYDIHTGTSTVFATEDGGRNWVAQKTVFGEEFMAICERKGHVWIAGDRVRTEPQKLLRLVPIAGDAE